MRSINISNGGVPKLPQPSARIRLHGLVGDRQRDRRFHGGPLRAVCIYSGDLIRALQHEGHPVEPGAIGENLTIDDIDWALVQAGAQLAIGEVILEVTTPASPCKNIAFAFAGDAIVRVSQKRHPGWSRWYCRVIREGSITPGDSVRIIAPGEAGGLFAPAPEQRQ